METTEPKKRASEAPGRGMLYLNKKKETGNTTSPHFHGKVYDEDGKAYSIAGWLHEDHDTAALREAGIWGISLSLREWKEKPVTAPPEGEQC